MTATTTSTDTIPLNKLAAWSGNVRKTGADTGLAELAASIAAHGLLQSLVVRKDKKGKFAVVAGRRRLRAAWGDRQEARLSPAQFPRRWGHGLEQREGAERDLEARRCRQDIRQ